MKNGNSLNVKYVLTNLLGSTTFPNTFWQSTPKSNPMVATSATRASYSATTSAPTSCQCTSLPFKKNLMELNRMFVPYARTDSNERIIWKNTWKRYMRRQGLFNATCASAVSARNTTSPYMCQLFMRAKNHMLVTCVATNRQENRVYNVIWGQFTMSKTPQFPPNLCNILHLSQH